MDERVDAPGRPTSPNRRDKQRQIVEAAKLVLVRDGLAACTARAVADASPLTKSAIHYYFESVEEIIDLAMISLLDEFLVRVRHAGEEHPDPIERFLAMAEEYLRVFAERPNYSLLWFGYWVKSSLEGGRDRMLAMQSSIISVVQAVLEEAGIADAPARARLVSAYLVGALVRQENEGTSPDQLAVELLEMIGAGSIAGQLGSRTGSSGSRGREPRPEAGVENAV
jgi:AcrR family transcriptional regulator